MEKERNFDDFKNLYDDWNRGKFIRSYPMEVMCSTNSQFLLHSKILTLYEFPGVYKQGTYVLGKTEN